MAITLDEATRKQVADFLPGLIEKILQSYCDFINTGPDLEADDAKKTPSNENTNQKRKGVSKSFAEHHSAGKVALTHLELLLELAALTKVHTDMSAEDIAYILTGIEEANEYRRLQVPGSLEDNDKNE